MSDWLIPIAVLGAKAGISVAFCFLYCSVINYFPSPYLGLVIGLVNVAGRGSTIAAPLVAEMRDPIPMMTSIMLCLMALIGTIMLKRPKKVSNLSN